MTMMGSIRRPTLLYLAMLDVGIAIVSRSTECLSHQRPLDAIMIILTRSVGRPKFLTAGYAQLAQTVVNLCR